MIFQKNHTRKAYVVKLDEKLAIKKATKCKTNYSC